MIMTDWIMAWAGAYLLGSMPCGLIWAKLLKHIDVRKQGSGRTGGANVWRSAGFPAALLTAISDALKGAAAIWLARGLGISPLGIAAAGALSIVGHNYSIFLGFRGGAGTATSIGAAAALWPATLPILIASGTGIALLVGHTSVASILIAILLPTLFSIHGDPAAAAGFGIPVMLLTLWALRPNIRRLLNQEERFLPIYLEKPPLVRLSRHPAANNS